MARRAADPDHADPGDHYPSAHPAGLHPKYLVMAMRSSEEPSWLSDTPQGPADTGGSDSGKVEKIRDILFGSQMRDYERRFADTEERLQREADILREDLGHRLAALEEYLRVEIEVLAGGLKAEEAERVRGLRLAGDSLAALHSELSARIGVLADESARQHRELRAQLAELQRMLAEEMERRHEELSSTLRREAMDLRSAKADRAVLAAVFLELAQRFADPDNR